MKTASTHDLTKSVSQILSRRRGERLTQERAQILPILRAEATEAGQIARGEFQSWLVGRVKPLAEFVQSEHRQMLTVQFELQHLPSDEFQAIAPSSVGTFGCPMDELVGKARSDRPERKHDIRSPGRHNLSRPGQGLSFKKNTPFSEPAGEEDKIHIEIVAPLQGKTSDLDVVMSIER